jgi:hypothetical protein
MRLSGITPTGEKYYSGDPTPQRGRRHRLEAHWLAGGEPRECALLRHVRPLALGVGATVLAQPMDRSDDRRELSGFFTPACPQAPPVPRGLTETKSIS